MCLTLQLSVRCTLRMPPSLVEHHGLAIRPRTPSTNVEELTQSSSHNVKLLPPSFTPINATAPSALTILDLTSDDEESLGGESPQYIDSDDSTDESSGESSDESSSGGLNRTLPDRKAVQHRNFRQIPQPFVIHDGGLLRRVDQDSED